MAETWGDPVSAAAATSRAEGAAGSSSLGYLRAVGLLLFAKCMLFVLAMLYADRIFAAVRALRPGKRPVEGD